VLVKYFAPGYARGQANTATFLVGSSTVMRTLSPALQAMRAPSNERTIWANTALLHACCPIYPVSASSTGCRSMTTKTSSP